MAKLSSSVSPVKQQDAAGLSRPGTESARGRRKSLRSAAAGIVYHWMDAAVSIGVAALIVAVVLPFTLEWLRSRGPR